MLASWGCQSGFLRHYLLSSFHIQVLEGITEDREETKKIEGCRTDWMLVAMVLDRFLLIVFFLLTIAVSAAILMNHPKHEENAELLVD